MTQELTGVDKIVGKYQGDRSALIQVLIEIQRENRWLPKEAWCCLDSNLPYSYVLQSLQPDSQGTTLSNSLPGNCLPGARRTSPSG